MLSMDEDSIFLVNIDITMLPYINALKQNKLKSICDCYGACP